MKLTKENVYINLRGKSKEELTELWEFLTSNGEIVSDNKEYFIEIHLKYNNSYIALGSDNAWKWWGAYKKTEVTIEQLKEILKMTRNQELIEEAKKRGYTHNNFKCLNESYNRTSIESLDKWYYNELEDTLFTNTRMNGGKAVYKNGVWAEIIKPMENREEQLRKEAIERGFVNGVEFFGSQGVDRDKPMLICDNIRYEKLNEDIGIWGLYVNNSWLCYNGIWGILAEETLEQQLQKAEAEVKRLKEAIEEENKIKVGDLVKCTNKESRAKCVIGVVEDLHPGYVGVGGYWYDKFEKITDSVLLESLNKLF